MNRRKLCPGAAAFLLLLFLACEMMGPEPEAAPGVEGKALVRIAIEAEGLRARTVSPQVNLSDVTSWKLRGGKSGESETPLGDFSDPTAKTFYLEPGSWNFTLTGYKDDDLILQGSLTGQTINLAGQNELRFTAAPVLDRGATGTFKIIINLPSGHGITSVQVLKDGRIEQPPFTPAGDTVVFEAILAAQNYYFSFLLYKDDDLYGVVSEAVQVRANLRSEDSRDLALTDLNRTFTITYHLKGGQLDGGGNPGYYHATDADFALPIPVYAGYDFGGWYAASDFSGAKVETIPQGSMTDMEFYAQWKPRQFAITLQFSDAGDGAFDQESFAVSKSEGTKPQTVRLSGKGYAGHRWFVDGDPKAMGSDIVIKAEDYTVGNHILSLEAAKDGWIWSKEIVFTVEAGNIRTALFRNNDAIGAIYAIKTLAAGSSLGGSFPVAPSRTGYDFKGWNTQADGGGTVFDRRTKVDSDATAYAQWKAKTYTVRFVINDGVSKDITKEVTFPATTISDFPSDPSRTDWNFAGWNTNADGSGLAFRQTTVVASDLTVYAQWAHTQFTISLSADAGEDAALSQEDFTLSTGGGGVQIISLTGAGYTNPRWFVDGDPKPPGTSITIRAAEYGVGQHSLTLLVTRNGVSWSKEITFIVTN
jgi:uncharacterized repeat protein (TIGR02543 family)